LTRKPNKAGLDVCLSLRTYIDHDCLTKPRNIEALRENDWAQNEVGNEMAEDEDDESVDRYILKMEEFLIITAT